MEKIRHTNMQNILDAQMALGRLAKREVSFKTAQKLSKLRIYLEDHVFAPFRKFRDETASKLGKSVGESKWVLSSEEANVLREKLNEYGKKQISIPLSLMFNSGDFDKTIISTEDYENIKFIILL